MDAHVMVYLSNALDVLYQLLLICLLIIYLIAILTTSCWCYDAICLCNGLYTLIELKQESSYAGKGLPKITDAASWIYEKEEESIT